jgi:hypothetical protein
LLCCACSYHKLAFQTVKLLGIFDVSSSSI